MVVPGLLIEYLINGVLALIWIYPLAQKHGLWNSDPSILAFVALSLYFVGMIIDFVAWIVTLPLKKIIRKQVLKKYDIRLRRESGSSHRRNAKFALYAPEIAKESNMRSSRDRVARGAIVNAILSTIYILPWPLGVGMIIISLLMWMGFEKASFGYEINAEIVIDEKNLSEIQTEASKQEPQQFSEGDGR